MIILPSVNAAFRNSLHWSLFVVVSVVEPSTGELGLPPPPQWPRFRLCVVVLMGGGFVVVLVVEPSTGEC